MGSFEEVRGELLTFCVCRLCLPSNHLHDIRHLCLTASVETRNFTMVITPCIGVVYAMRSCLFQLDVQSLNFMAQLLNNIAFAI